MVKSYLLLVTECIRVLNQGTHCAFKLWYIGSLDSKRFTRNVRVILLNISKATRIEPFLLLVEMEVPFAELTEVVLEIGRSDEISDEE
ncbi:hypothetical protein NPIL_127611 [Nephila pilipes]|uniref:Uncharacterized protein n=1 Tax=Nephila pilipes TaxID=299642 RepID=A0A8X6P5K9_NEPPI|nr:hypothetical protein NPIL_127611 [Nephila pilipes]